MTVSRLSAIRRSFSMRPGRHGIARRYGSTSRGRRYSWTRMGNLPTREACLLTDSLMLKIGRAHVLNPSHANISYAVFCLKKKHKHIEALTASEDKHALAI